MPARICPPGEIRKKGKCVASPKSTKLKKGQKSRRSPMEMELPREKNKRKKLLRELPKY